MDIKDLQDLTERLENNLKGQEQAVQRFKQAKLDKDQCSERKDLWLCINCKDRPECRKYDLYANAASHADKMEREFRLLVQDNSKEIVNALKEYIKVLSNI